MLITGDQVHLRTVRQFAYRAVGELLEYVLGLLELALLQRAQSFLVCIDRLRVGGIVRRLCFGLRLTLHLQYPSAFLSRIFAAHDSSQPPLILRVGRAAASFRPVSPRAHSRERETYATALYVSQAGGVNSRRCTAPVITNVAIESYTCTVSGANEVSRPTSADRQTS